MPLVLVLLIQFVQGMLIGVANVIPGVSGGTVAVVLGLYDRLITTLSGFFREKRWKTDGWFLVTLFAGVLSGVVLFSRVVLVLQDLIPEQTNYLFAGLILGSLPFLIKLAGTRQFKPMYLIPFFITLGIMLFQAFFQKPEPSLPIVDLSWAVVPGLFLAGVVSAATMIIPGVSGSFLLILIGWYSNVLNAVKSLNFPILLVFAAGALVGIIFIAKLLNFLLKRFHSWTYYGIIGLVLGSIVDLIVRAQEPAQMAISQIHLGPWTWPLNVVLFLVGLILALLLSSRKPKKEVQKSELHS